MKYNISANIAKAKATKDELNRVSRYFKPKKGVTRFRIVPIGKSEDGGVYPFKQVRVYGYNAFKGRVISPETYGGEDPIRAKILELMNSGEVDQSYGTELLKRFRAGTRYIVPVVIRQDGDSNGKNVNGEGDVKLLDLARGQFEYVLKAFLDEEEYGSVVYPGDIGAPAGYDFKIDKGQRPNGDWFVDLEVVRKPSTLADTDEKIESLMKVDLDKIFKEEFKVMSDEDLLKKFGETLAALHASISDDNGQPAATNETTYQGTQPSEAHKSAQAPTTQVSDAELDALMSDDLLR